MILRVSVMFRFLRMFGNVFRATVLRVVAELILTWFGRIPEWSLC
jgi:hypothetical protein